MIWRVCERFCILPPNINKNFAENSQWMQACLIAYEQVRQVEGTIEDVKS